MIGSESSSVRRYGKRSAAAEEAWNLLLETAYRTPGNTTPTICVRPRFRCDGPGVKSEPPPYDNAKLARAWHKLLICADELGNADTYRFDLVHLNRQVLANTAFSSARAHHRCLRKKGSARAGCRQ